MSMLSVVNIAFYDFCGFRSVAERADAIGIFCYIKSQLTPLYLLKVWRRSVQALWWKQCKRAYFLWMHPVLKLKPSQTRD